MIYYFSGTGNSQYVAEKIAEYTKDTAVFMPQAFDRMQSDISVEEGETVGVVFPVYAWAPPAFVMDFLSHIHVNKKAFTYAVCTCGDEAGKTMDALHHVFAFKSAYSITMPNTYIPMYNTDEPELEREKINIAAQRLPKIAAEISAHREIFDVFEGPEASFKTFIINPLFSLFAMRTSKFSADSTCIGCGECVKNCPFHVIKLTSGKPVWQEEKCSMCMSCIMRCPKRAIQYGIGTKKRGRYVFPVFKKNQQVILPDAEPEKIQNIPTVLSGSSIEIIRSSEIRTVMNPVVTVRKLYYSGNSESDCIAVTETHVKQGGVEPRCAHVSAELILYALKGCAKLLFTGNLERSFSAGDVVHFTENAVYGLENTDNDEFIYLSVSCPSVKSDNTEPRIV
ncbi:MAG: EFR1 family ferrodoxin [Treponema sp.]|nr:EFR1 family ferrodoxin [Treponema sp.]